MIFKNRRANKALPVAPRRCHPMSFSISILVVIGGSSSNGGGSGSSSSNSSSNRSNNEVI